MTMRFLFVFIYSICCGYLSESTAQSYAFSPIDVNSGLSDNQVRNVAQLKDGRMVITTQGQVNVYDGSGFKYLHYTDKNSMPLSGYSGFHHDYVAGNGYLWLKNDHRLFAIDIRKDQFISDPAILLRSWGFNMPLSDFFMDQQHSLWLITKNDDLYYLPEGQHKTQLFLKGISKLTGSSDQIHDLVLQHQQLYLFLRSGMLICLDLKTKKEIYRRRSPASNQSAKYTYTSFVMAGPKHFYQLRNGVEGGLLLCYDLEKRSWKTVMQTSYWLNYISTDEAGNKWVACKEGMWLFNADLSKKRFIAKLKLVDGQAIVTEVSTILHDRQAGMWLGTLNRGLLYYHPDRFKFRNIGKTFFQLGNDATVNVTCFTKLKNGNLLVGTQQGLFQYQEMTETITPWIGAGTLKCNAILQDRANRIWLATNGQGLVNIDPNGKIRYYPTSPRTIHSMRENADGSLMVHSNAEGFGTFYPASGSYQRVATSSVDSFNDVYQTFPLDENRVAGIGSQGFFIYEVKNGKIEAYHDGRSYQTILVDREKKIWLGSKDGLHLWNKDPKYQRSFYTDEGLINNYIQSITQAPDGAIWVSTSGGLTKINQEKDSYTFAGYNRLDGVIANEFWERAVYTSPDGSIYWGGTDGFNILPASRTFRKQPTNAPLFVDFLLFNKKVAVGFPFTREILLEHDQNFFSIEFSALNYVNPTQTYYRYQLSGVDVTEQELQSDNGNGRVNYTNMRPGTYYFKVRSAGNNNDWQNNFAELKITIKAPFWKTELAYGLYMILVSATFIFCIRLYTQKKRKKFIAEQKEKLDQMKAAFIENLNTEISDPLEKIIAPMDQILKHTEEGRLKHQLKEIQENAVDLKTLVQQLFLDVLSPAGKPDDKLNLELLMLNMRQLLEVQHQRKQSSEEKAQQQAGNDTILAAADEKLILRALRHVEDNLDNPNYSVELLSLDLGMDRTGLYRKLVHLIGKTPSTFIRSVRLKRAALLLEEGLTVAEVADSVGFSTASYFTKCFQEEFEMKPSQYVASLKRKPS